MRRCGEIRKKMRGTLRGQIPTRRRPAASSIFFFLFNSFAIVVLLSKLGLDPRLFPRLELKLLKPTLTARIGYNN